MTLQLLLITYLLPPLVEKTKIQDMEAGNGPLKMAQFKFRESCPCNTFSQTKIGANGDKGLGQEKIKKKTKKGVGKILKC